MKTLTLRNGRLLFLVITRMPSHYPSSKQVAKRHPNAYEKAKREQKRKQKVAKAGGFKGILKRELTGKQQKK